MIEPIGPDRNQRSPTLAHCVIGSGPAGVACAQALLQRGARVTMLDAGVWLEPEREALIAQMRTGAPESWTPDQIDRLKEGTDAGTKGIPRKLVHGSDFPYQEAEQHVPADYDGVGVCPSLARGGFSNVWGAAMMPYAERDTLRWPIRIPDLAEHYAAVLRFTGLAAGRDDLERSFPLHRVQPATLELSRQSSLLLRRWEQNRAALERAGIQFGRARVAVRTAGAAQAGCVYCGLCMYGCPYGYIYNAADTVLQLQEHRSFSYQPDQVITSLEESASRVLIRGYHRTRRAPFEASADRVYVACGAIPSANIVLRSLALYDRTVWMRDSQYFLLPLASARGVGGVREESLHTLSQLFLEIFDSEVSPHTVHLQIYSYNDLIGRAVRKTLGPLAGPLEFVARGLEGRLLAVQGYLHSDHSSRIAVTLRKGTPDRLELKAELNGEARPMIGRVIKKLLGHARQLGAVPLSPMLQVGTPGRGFHTGGTFPMSAEPGATDTDLLGRPGGWSRVHVVDSTVLPSVPATTITLSVMANAHRIGWQSANLP